MTESGRTVIGYLRVSTEDQASSGLGLIAQRQKISQAASARNWEIKWIADEALGAGDLQRPGISEVLDLLRGGDAIALVAAKLDRLSRSVLDFAKLLERSEKEGWGLVLLDLDLDTTTPAGRLVAHVMSAIAEFERARIRERTREALAAARAKGVRLGRPSLMPEEVRKRIHREREEGSTLAAISEGLNADGMPTAHGGSQWWPSTVRAALRAEIASSIAS